MEIDVKVLEEEIRSAFKHGQGNAENMEAGLERNEIEDYVSWVMIKLTKKKVMEKEVITAKRTFFIWKLEFWWVAFDRPQFYPINRNHLFANVFWRLTKPQKDFLTWYTTGNNKHYSGDKLIEKYKKEVLNM